MRLVTEQDPQHLMQDSSILSTNITTVKQSHIEPTTSRNHHTPPPEYDTSASSMSQQSSCSDNNINGLITNTRQQFTFRSSFLERPSDTRHPYTPAQITADTNIPTTFNINMIHTNPSPNIATSRTLSRPPILHKTLYTL